MSTMPKGADIRPHYNQKFYHFPGGRGSAAAGRILQLVQEGVITKQEVDIIRYLYHFRTSTMDRIARDCMPGADQETVDRQRERLMTLAKQGVLNWFNLTTGLANEERLNENAEVFWCLDTGAMVLLRSLLDDETLINWRASDSVTTATSVKKCLMNADMHHFLVSAGALPDVLTAYRTYPLYAIRGSRFMPKAVYTIGNRVCIQDAVCASDMYDGTTARTYIKLDTISRFLRDNENWQAFFPDAGQVPVLVLLYDRKDAAEDFNRQIQYLEIPEVITVCMDEIGSGSTGFYTWNQGLEPVKESPFETEEVLV